MKEILPPCASWGVKLTSHMDHLSPTEQAALRVHLQDCPSCAAHKAEYQFTDEILETLPTIPPSIHMLPSLLEARRIQQRTPSSKALLGKQLGNYHLIHFLGSGGFADVYLGEHIYLRTTAAIKVLQTQIAQESRTVFHQEARIIASLVHPHIVRVLDFAVEQDTPFLVMDYASKGSLRQLHQRGKPLPLLTVVSYITQIAAALQYAHDQNVIHRDVKPANMLLGRYGEVLLSDFGIAKLADSTSALFRTAATTSYAAPEQKLMQLHPSVDQYSLGIVAYEWLCGERPFKGAPAEIAFKHRFEPPPLLRDRNPSISPAVELVVLTALEKDPHKRFSSVRAFAEALEQASHVQSVQSRFLGEENIERRKVQPRPAYQPLPSVNYRGVTPTGGLFALSDTHIPSEVHEVPATKRRTTFSELRSSQKVMLLLSAILVLLLNLFSSQITSSTIHSHGEATATATHETSTTSGAWHNITINKATASDSLSQHIYAQAVTSSPILHDSLSNGTSGNWRVTDTKNYRCIFVGGAYLIQTKQRNSVGTCLAHIDDNFYNFAFQVDMVITSGGSGGITFQTNNNERYLFEISSNSAFRLLAMENNKDKAIAISGTSLAIKTGLHQTNKIAVIAYQNDMYAYANGDFVARMRNVRNIASSIGLFAADSSTQQTEAAFKNAVVWEGVP